MKPMISARTNINGNELAPCGKNSIPKIFIGNMSCYFHKAVEKTSKSIKKSKIKAKPVA